MKFADKGFTLFEVLLAILILAIGIVALAQAFSAGMYSSTNAGTFIASDAESVDLALNIAQAKMEEIKNQALTDFTHIVSVPKAPVTGFGSYSQWINVTPKDTSDPLTAKWKQVDITVYWTTRNGDTSISLSTYIANSADT